MKTTITVLFAALAIGAGAASAQTQSTPAGGSTDKVQPDSVAGSTGGLSNTGNKTNPDASAAKNMKKKSPKHKKASSATGDGTVTNNKANNDSSAATPPDTGSKGSLVTNEAPPPKR
ncbi:MAG TPA: hypothetical protein VGP06_12290 [Janthinobacterium sp.]|jgi:hypothetical protein|nr:hypothetical protein [Janthinobacterium sp.]